MLLGPFLVAIGATVWDALVEAQCGVTAGAGGHDGGGTLYDSQVHTYPRRDENEPALREGDGQGGPEEEEEEGQQQRHRMLRSPGEPGSVRRFSFSPIHGSSGSSEGAALSEPEDPPRPYRPQPAAHASSSLQTRVSPPALHGGGSGGRDTAVGKEQQHGGGGGRGGGGGGGALARGKLSKQAVEAATHRCDS